MTREAVINGCPVKVTVRDQDINRVLNDLCHNPDAVHAYADDITARLPGLLDRYGSSSALAYSYARQAYAAQEAWQQLNNQSEAA